MTTADDVLACIRRYPGIHLRGLERELGLASPLVHYHAKQLEREGRIVSAAVGGYTRYWPSDLAEGMPAEERGTLALLREEVALHVVLLLLERGPLPQADLVQALGLAKSTVSYHVEKMVQRGLLERRGVEAGTVVALRDAKRVRRLLRAHEPTADLLRRFRDLWMDFYGGR